MATGRKKKQTPGPFPDGACMKLRWKFEPLQVDVDALEKELDEEERRQEESRKKHFDDLKGCHACPWTITLVGFCFAPPCKNFMSL